MRDHYRNYFLSLTLLLAMLFGINTNAQTGKSLVLNGVNQYMRIKHDAVFNIAKDESFTITLWVKANRYMPLSSAQRFISKRDIGIAYSETGGDEVSSYELWGAVSSSQFYANNAPGPNNMAHTNSMSVFSSRSGALDTWVHIAFVVDRQNGTTGKMFLYQNGAESGTSGTKDISPWYVNNTKDVLVGMGIRDGEITYPLQGEIDNLRFYKRALSAAEITSDMTGTVSSETTGLIAAYDFETIEGTSVLDISGKGHNGTLYNFPIDGECKISDVALSKNTNFTGRGNNDEYILKSTVTGSGTVPVKFSSMVINMDGTSDLSNISKIKVYSTKDVNSFDPRKVNEYVKLGECDPAEGDITCALSGELATGSNYIWLAYDISETAKEGDIIDGTIKSITTSKELYEITGTAPTGSREILLGRKLLFAPGDLGSVNYRIPGILTAKDGSLITVTDKRKVNQSDLPEDIDILVRRSTDNGKTWSEALTIAQGTGRYQGFGDAALVQTNEEGGLLCIFVGGPGFFESTPSNPIRTYICKSSDNGVTWTSPEDITSQLYGASCSDATRRNWYGSFCGSGAGLLSSDGIIYFVASVRESSVQSAATIANYVYYSADNGTTWNVSSCVKTDNGNESKIIELNDGTLLVSIRNQSKGARYYSTSTDKGATWSAIKKWEEMVEPGCNGDIVYYTSTKNNYEKNRIIHSVPNHATNRENVSVFLSYDECKTWPIKKTICKTGSAYSSLCILPDGTIGAYVEENYNTDNYSTYFTNFSLDWLTNGVDTYHAAGTVEAVKSPRFSIEGGAFDSPISIALTVETPDAKIYYTTNGTTPTEESTLYTEPIELSESATIKAIGVKEGMVTSAISTETYTFSPAGKYCYPTVQTGSTDVRNTYIEKVTTEGGTENINYSATERLAFSKVGKVTVPQDGTFTLTLKGKSLGDYSTSTVLQDLRYTVAIMYIDWNKDYIFSLDEGSRLAGKLSSEGLHNVGGNVDVLNITKEIKIPANTEEGIYRVRVYYTNAWETESGAMSKVCGTIIDGVAVDLDINVTKGSGINSNSNNSIGCYTDNNNIVITGANEGSILNIYNQTGMLVYSGITNDTTTTVRNILNDGTVYIVQISDGMSLTVKKVVK